MDKITTPQVGQLWKQSWKTFLGKIEYQYHLILEVDDPSEVCLDENCPQCDGTIDIYTHNGEELDSHVWTMSLDHYALWELVS